MVGQKQKIIKRLEREAKKKYKKMEEAGLKLTCACSKPKWHLVSFNVDEIKDIIMNFNQEEIYGCGHKRSIVILDSNELSAAAYFTWADTVGYDGDKSQCWDCYCTPKNKMEKKQ